ncbi:MAG TPA: glycosyltransferase family 4 protein [Stellaceae bacterium]|jgi:glycosyltransferase involved in cell wall biosynthesis
MGAEPEIAVIDDFFPHKLSAFRYEEFHAYLEAMPRLSVHATWPHLKYFGEERPPAEVFAEYAREHPAHAGRVQPLFDGTFPPAEAYYTIFLSNIREHLWAIEARRRPFAFTMYPGGGFAMDVPELDKCMERVFASPCFRKVIATQPIIRDYVLDKGFCEPHRVVFIHGGVVPRSAFEPPPPKPRYGLAKAALDIAFVAAKYSPIGADKGYDLFVEAAKVLVALGIDARFHVVGGFDPGTLDLGPAASRFRFYGYRPREFFATFHSLMDMFVSPTRAFTLSKGAFDGFPTGAAIEAGLQCVALLLTDPLGFNTMLRDGEDAIIVQPDRDNIVARILQLASHPDRLAAIGENGRVALTASHGYAAQIAPRLAVLRSLPDE